MSNTEKRFLSSLLDHLFNPKKDSEASVKNNRVQKTLQSRALLMEPLEERQLLAVTAIDYLAIQNSFESLKLDDYSSVNLIEIDNASLTSESLKNAITQAGSTSQNDVILVRTTPEKHTIDLNGELLNINIDSNAFGSINILGYGDSMLHLTNSGLTVLSVENGDVGFGKINFVSLDNDVVKKETVLNQEEKAVVLTQQVLFSACYSVNSKELTTSSISNEVAEGYYSAEFQLEGSKWVYITGLSEFEARDIENNINAGTVDFYVGTFFDAEKNGVNDSQHCWAGTSANMLHYTNWDYFLHGNEDDTFDVFRNNFTNQAGHTYYGNEWFINGDYSPQGWGGWAQISGDGGGYYSAYNLNYGDYATFIDTASYYASNSESPIAEVGRLMENGAGIGISLGWYDESEGEEENEVIYTRAGGHAITMWGFVYDDEKEAGALDYYVSVIVTDSDDNYGQGRNAPDRLQTYGVTWHEDVGGYQFDSYGRGETFSGIIEGFSTLTQKPDNLYVNDIFFSTPEGWSAPVVVTRSENSHVGQTRFSSDVPLYMSIGWFQTDTMNTYNVTVSDNGEIIQSFSVSGDVGINQRLLNLGTPEGGFHNYVITMDSNNNIDEGDENNNVYSLTVEVIEIVVTTSEDVIDSTDGVLSLREAINQINSGDLPEGGVIHFSDEVTARTIHLTEPLEIEVPMTIDATRNSQNDKPGITISGENLHQIFSINVSDSVNETIAIKGLALENGFDANGGAIYHNGNANTYYNFLLQDCIISNSTADYGGAIYNEKGSLQIEDTFIRNNSANKDGGAIYLVNGSLTTNGVTIEKNKAVNGGAIFAVSSSEGTNSIRLQNSFLTENQASETGGAIRSWNCVINDSLIENNSAYSGAGIASWNNLTLNNSSVISNGLLDENELFICKYGGGIFASGDLTLGDGTEISGNNAYYGGGIFLFQRDNQTVESNLNLATSSSINNNQANSGGGIYVNTGGAVEIASGNIVNNRALVNGGGIFNYTGTVRIVNGQQISGNIALKGNGGGIYNDGNLEVSSHGMFNNNIAGLSGGGIFNGSILVIDQGSISGNNAYDGGGIYNIGTMTISNSLFMANVSQNHGGAIFNQASIYPVSIVDTTIAGNRARYKAGGIYNAGVIDVNNSIIAKNFVQTETLKTRSDLYTLKSSNAVSRISYSLISDPTDTEKPFVGEFNIVGTQYEPIDPIFISFDVNSPYSEWDLRLQFRNSPAINAGPVQDDSSSSDYDGTVRKTGLAKDMGAFEMYETPSLIITTLDDVVDETDGLTSLREAVEYLKANPNRQERTITFDENLAGGTIYLTQGTLWINASMTIDASELYNPQTLLSGITINGKGINRVFYIAQDTTEVVLNSLTITGGYIDDQNKGEGLYTDGGSGIYNRGELSLINCVVAGNMTTYYGGAIFNRGTLSVVNSTIAGNYASIGGGVYNMGSASIQNSIIAKNRSTDAHDIWTDHDAQSLVDYSLIGNASYVTGKEIESETDPTTYLAGSSSEPIDPKFIAYSIYSIKDWNYDIANGWNLRIENNSPAYNAGSNDLAVDSDKNPLERDIAYNNRIFDEIVDLGAYEATPEIPSIIVTTLVDRVNEYDGGISLREAIKYAETYDLATTISFASGLAGQTLVLNGTELLINKSISIDASNLINSETYDPGIVIDAQGLSRIFSIVEGTDESPISVEISGLRLQNGLSSENGGAIYNAGLLSLVDIQLVNNVALSGGAIYNDNVLMIEGSELNSNKAQYLAVPDVDENDNPILDVLGGYGGAIYNAGQLNISSSVLYQNSASEGGAILNGPGATLIADSLTVIDNEVTDFKYNKVYDEEGNIISLDICGGDGGAISNVCDENEDSELILANSFISNSIFFGNSATMNGGAFFNEGNATFVNCTIAGNSAEFGGGIYNDLNSVLLQNSIIAKNYSSDNADIGTSIDDETTTICDYCLVGNTQTLKPESNKVVDFDLSANSIFDLDPQFFVSPAFDENGVLLNLETLDLQIGIDSPAFNTGSNDLAVDQSGNPLEYDITSENRIAVGTVDMGSFEWHLVVTTASDIVDSNDNVLSLREAITIAQDGDIITFDESLFRSIISLNNKELVVSKAIKIDASDLWDYEYDQPGITIDAHLRSRIFNVNGTMNEDNPQFFSIDSLSMINGITSYKGGAIINSFALNINHSIISSNSTYYGGAIYNTGLLFINQSTLSGNSATYAGAIYTTASGTTILLGNSVLDSNQATYGGTLYNKGNVFIGQTRFDNGSAKYGGAIYNYAGSVTVSQSSFDNNSVDWKGGAIYNYTNADLSIKNDLFEEGSSLDILFGSFFDNDNADMTLFANNSTYYGGAIYNIGTAQIENAEFDFNEATLGGAIYHSGSGSMTIESSNFANNEAGNYGGALCNNGSSLEINESFFDQNNAHRGGAIYNYTKEMTLSGSSFLFNSASKGAAIFNAGTIDIETSSFESGSALYGGAIYNANFVNVVDSEFFNNVVSQNGGAIYHSSNKSSTIYASILAGNQANSGGAIYVNTGSIIIINSIISGNQALKNGGGIYNNNSVTVTNSTVAGNTAFYYGGGIYNNKTLRVNNSILAKNNTTTNRGYDLFTGSASTTSSMINYSLIENYAKASSVGKAFTGNNNLLKVDPLFEHFEDYDFNDWSNDLWADWDFSLKSNSSAIDAGSNALAVDAEGNILETDYFGNERIFNDIVDLGAIEYNPNTEE
ncbi:MAG: choice-of-anchor Q domain-containing protein [Planctomycetia bacterium]|nr:choice-of-anchor Q domain-containing protein [Planctomycetia bacterium]